jgi:DNA-binding CsgD family transcriptional regulator
VFGRDAELSRVLAGLRRVHDGAAIAIVVTGEPGIGKTTLLDEVVRTMSGGIRVVRSTAAEGEHDLPAATLIALLAPLGPDIERLHEPHRSVLSATSEHGELAPTVALGLALVNLIDLVSARTPLAIVLDDAQWADELSSTVLGFAMRRSLERPIAVLAATRHRGWPAMVDADMVHLDGVDEAAGRSILERTGPIAASVATRLQASCGGNPLAMQQVAQSLTATQRSGREELPDPIPLDGGLADVLTHRLSGLPERTVRALAVLAASGAGDAHVIHGAWRALGVDGDDLSTAEQADVVVCDERGVRFVHPLLRSAAMAAAGPDVRRRAHRALADATDELDRRAHHLDRAADGVDAEAASALEQAARRASDARAYDVAGRAWERAAHRSTTPTDRGRRLVEATQCHWNAGRHERGVDVGREAADLVRDGPMRAGLLLALGDMTFFQQDAAAGVRTVLDEAETIARTDPATSATMLAIGANLVALTGDLARAARLVDTSVHRATSSGDPIATLTCETLAAHIGLIHGRHPPDDARVRELVDLVGLIDDHTPRELASLGQLVVFDLLSIGRWDDALVLGDKVLVQARRHGLANIEAFVHGLLGEVAWRRGRWIEARAESLIEYGFNESRLEPTGSFGHATLARVDAATGRLDEARVNARIAADHGRRTGIRVMESWGLHALGLAALADGDSAGAVDALMPIWELCSAGEIGAPGPLWWQGDLVEALWRSGRRQDLVRLVAELDVDAARTRSDWADAVAARGRGLLDANAEHLLASALILDRLGAPFEAARSRLLIGEVDASREWLEPVVQAAAVLHRLGARPWAHRTGERVGSTRSDEVLVNALSRAELRVALLVGRGHTNREVADELFISPRTVDSHLQRIYRKLDLRSRTELALLVAEQLS